MLDAAAVLKVLPPREFYALVRLHRVWFTPMQAAAYLGVKPRTLESWRARDAGPKFRGAGKTIRYHVDDLDSFASLPAATCRRNREAALVEANSLKPSLDSSRPPRQSQELTFGDRE